MWLADAFWKSSLVVLNFNVNSSVAVILCSAWLSVFKSIFIMHIIVYYIYIYIYMCVCTQSLTKVSTPLTFQQPFLYNFSRYNTAQWNLDIF